MEKYALFLSEVSGLLILVSLCLMIVIRKTSVRLSGVRDKKCMQPEGANIHCKAVRGFVFLRADESWKRIFKNLSLGMATSVVDLCGIAHGTPATWRPWLSWDISSVYHNSLCEKPLGFHEGGRGLPLLEVCPLHTPSPVLIGSPVESHKRESESGWEQGGRELLLPSATPAKGR